MSKRDEYVAKLKTQLDAWDTELDKLEVKAGKAKKNAKVKYAKEMKELKVKRDKMKTEINNIINASEDGWEDFKDKAGDAWSALKGGFIKAREAFQKDDEKKPGAKKKAATAKVKTTTVKASKAKATTTKAPKEKTPATRKPKAKK